MNQKTNSHVHTFTVEDVPAFLAKKLVPFPLYYLTHFPTIFKIYRGFQKFKFNILRKIKAAHTMLIAFIKSNPILNFVHELVFYSILALTLISMLDRDIVIAGFTIPKLNGKAIFFLAILLSVYSSVARSILFLVIKFLFKPLGLIPNKKTLEFWKRYLNIAAIAKYKNQSEILEVITDMYPAETKFIVLSMDMEYMEAGKTSRSYLKQLEELNNLYLKNQETITPFIFVDPRRFNDPKHKELFFDWEMINDKIVLKKCTLKTYLEADSGPSFQGIKIYPALGYYPFQEELLPLWKYCVQESIPITTHCSIGPIFYRGNISFKNHYHPFFKNSKGDPLEIFEKRNIEFQRNFTHPLNFLILLDPELLTKHLASCSEKIQKVFSYDDQKKKIKWNLSTLKINFAHYGGEEALIKYLENDREHTGKQIIKNPERGLEMLHNITNGKLERNEAKPAWLWNRADWYTLISSLILQYENIYTDISYVLHIPKVNELIKLSLQNEKLKEKILFGTDYYVVRNHKTEKEIYSNFINYYESDEIDFMSSKNPEEFLRRTTKDNTDPIPPS